MALVVRQTLAGRAWVAHPERALSPRQCHALLLAAAVISGGIATAFAFFGAWPVLPFAGLEVLALWAALRHLRRHADDEERLEIGERELLLIRRTAGREERVAFDRYWVQLRTEKPPDGRSPRLWLRSHGREVEIGRLLTGAQKKKLAEEIGKMLGSGR